MAGPKTRYFSSNGNGTRTHQPKITETTPVPKPGDTATAVGRVLQEPPLGPQRPQPHEPQPAAKKVPLRGPFPWVMVFPQLAQNGLITVIRHPKDVTAAWTAWMIDRRKKGQVILMRPLFWTAGKVTYIGTPPVKKELFDGMMFYGTCELKEEEALKVIQEGCVNVMARLGIRQAELHLCGKTWFVEAQAGPPPQK